MSFRLALKPREERYRLEVPRCKQGPHIMAFTILDAERLRLRICIAVEERAVIEGLSCRDPIKEHEQCQSAPQSWIQLERGTSH